MTEDKAPKNASTNSTGARTAAGTGKRQKMAAKKQAAKKQAEQTDQEQTDQEQAAGKDQHQSKKQPKKKKSAGTASKRKAETLVVGADESPWSASELAEVSQELEEEAARLRAEIDDAEDDLAELLREGGEGAGDDQADVGSAAFEREHELSLARNARDMLDQIGRALRRIDDGTYGVCEGCGNPIGKARLQAFPRATLCVSCKQREERR